jgi:hypothetical protein
MVMPSGAPASQVRPLGTSDAGTNLTWTPDNHLITDQANVLNLVDPVSGNKSVIPGQNTVGGSPRACGSTGSIVFVHFQGGGANHLADGLIRKQLQADYEGQTG